MYYMHTGSSVELSLTEPVPVVVVRELKLVLRDTARNGVGTAVQSTLARGHTHV